MSYLILCWWVNKTRVISFSLQLIKLDAIDLEWGEGRGKNQKPGQLALKAFMNRFVKHVSWKHSILTM